MHGYVIKPTYKLCDVITHPCHSPMVIHFSLTPIGIWAWMRYHIRQKTMDVIDNPCHNISYTCYKNEHTWSEIRITERRVVMVPHYNDVIMSALAFQITSLTIVYSTIYSGADQSTHQSSASLAFVLGIHRWPVNSPQKWPVTRKTFPFDDVIVNLSSLVVITTASGATSDDKVGINSAMNLNSHTDWHMKWLDLHSNLKAPQWTSSPSLKHVC